MSIFRETFPAFVTNELGRRQKGMADRNPAFLHQLNSRSAWVRMTSGVDFEGSSELAKKYVMQGGILNYSLQDRKDSFTQKAGLGNSSNAYSNVSPGGATHRTGIRPMPGITNVSIQSKGAYGSLQEATVTFTCWDIKQLEELEVLYMRPGYTVLLEFGWDFARVNGALPSYDILNKREIVLNDAFAEIYQLIDQSGGTYDALLGYVKNYNWSARDDGGYDCTTSIISLGEVLESLKCNWVPSETIAFDNDGKGILQLSTNTISNAPKIIESYEKGIIPGLLQELWDSMEGLGNGSTNVITDNKTGNYYYLYKLIINDEKNERGGLEKPLGPKSKAEIYITLGSFCDLISTYVLPRGAKNKPLSEIITYETDYNSSTYIKYSKTNSTNSPEALFSSQPTSNAFATSLKCIASPLALSTNLGVCFVKNDNWDNLEVQVPEPVEESIPEIPIPADVQVAVENKGFGFKLTGNPQLLDNNVFKRFAGSITKQELPSTVNPLFTFSTIADVLSPPKYYTYKSQLGLQGDIDQLATDLGNAITNAEIVSVTDSNGNTELKPRFKFFNGASFIPSSQSNYSTIDITDYFGTAGGFRGLYDELFKYNYDPTPPGKLNLNTIGSSTLFTGTVEDPFEDGEFKYIKDNTGKTWVKTEVISALNKALSSIPINDVLQRRINEQLPEVAKQVAETSTKINDKNALPFLETNSSNTKQLGYISNIYVNLNYLYEQAISKNTASNDTQNKNNISIRSYLQTILRDIQNSLGNINNFDIQVDNRNAIGRIIDINFTGDPTQKLFTLQIHNLNSAVRDYKFSSKIFPEMGSIIAISAQDASGIGKLGYDNATLVAWNEGISDRLIPKKDFNSDIALSKSNNPATFLLPFLTKIYNYFQYVNGKKITDNINYAYGGLDFAYRDFLSNLDRFDPQNRFKTIIPTELTVTLDGIGGIIIGNLFKINQDIVPKGYRNVPGRDIAYIVTRLGHQISGNDWTTELNAYPVVFEKSTGVNVWKQWDNDQYPGTVLRAGGRTLLIGKASISNLNQNNIKQAVKFFISKGFSDIQTAALVGGFIQESKLNPEITNPNGGAYGIAQWFKDRKKSLLAKPNPSSLNTQLNFVIEEFNSTEKAARDKLKKAKTLEEAIAAAAAYERFEGISLKGGVTYEEVLNAKEVGFRIEFAQELLNNISKYK